MRSRKLLKNIFNNILSMVPATVSLKPDKIKPPIKVVKISAEKLFLDNKTKTMKQSIINNILDATSKVNELTIHSYQFLRLYVLNNYESDVPIPLMDEELLKTIFNVLTKKSAGPKSKNEYLENINNFYITEYAPLIYDIDISKLSDELKFDGKNLSGILDYQITDMVTNINNNIQMNFRKYLNQFIYRTLMSEVYDNNKSNNNIIILYKQLKEDHKKYKNEDKIKVCATIIKTLQDINKSIRKQVRRDTHDISDCMLNGTGYYNPLYNDWLEKYTDKLVPKFKVTSSGAYKS